MKLDIKQLLLALGLPVTLAIAIPAILAFLGISLDQVIAIGSAMLGAQALIALLIEILKYANVVNDGTSGKWSAAFNLVLLAGVVVALKSNPAFDFPQLDAQLAVFAQFGLIIFGYIVQIVGTKQMHAAYTKGLGITRFSYRLQAGAVK